MEDEREYNFLLNNILMNRNINFSQYRPQILKRRIQHRLHLSGCTTFLEYIALLNKEPLEYDELLDCLTIKVSEFFRDFKVFDKLSEIVLPEIISQKLTKGDNTIRAWSCGAAHGQEAFSLAILFSEAQGRKFVDFDIKIIASDIDKKALAEGPWSSYSREALRKMAPHFLFKYFTQFQENGVNRYIVNDRAKDLVSFLYHNVISDRPIPSVDLILCRNLLIYFEKELQVKTINNLFSALNPGGFLVLGKTENLPPQLIEYFETVDLRERIYRKK